MLSGITLVCIAASEIHAASNVLLLTACACSSPPVIPRIPQAETDKIYDIKYYSECHTLPLLWWFRHRLAGHVVTSAVHCQSH